LELCCCGDFVIVDDMAKHKFVFRNGRTKRHLINLIMVCGLVIWIRCR
jgi:hypothetical protein